MELLRQCRLRSYGPSSFFAEMLRTFAPFDRAVFGCMVFGDTFDEGVDILGFIKIFTDNGAAAFDGCSADAFPYHP
ncbi:hypothetical protein [Ruegeria profundi]|uniref:hypothetical protein n=1 Tax=Ruegeria profundi TaxID=1685378 RepID=UPI001CD1E39C|nr:hypothetical protein [Ruegeria profundi]MCA0927544.1 hypothetical protein [Ruegeria profundi]